MDLICGVFREEYLFDDFLRGMLLNNAVALVYRRLVVQALKKSKR